MNAVGIDVSKGKSMVAIMRPFGEIVLFLNFKVIANFHLQFPVHHNYGKL